MHSTARTRPLLLIVIFWLIAIGVALTFLPSVFAWIAKQGLIWLPLYLINVQFVVFLGCAFWLGFRNGGISKWTFVVPVLAFLVYCIAATLPMLWNFEYQFSWGMVEWFVWIPFKTMVVSAIVSYVMQRSLGLVLVPYGNSIDVPPLSIRDIMICVALVAVLLAIDGRLAPGNLLLGKDSNPRKLYLGVAYLLNPAINVLGFAGLAWLISAPNIRRWIGGFLLCSWLLAREGSALVMTTFIMPALEDVSAQAPWVRPWWYHPAFLSLLTLGSFLAIIGVFRACGYSMVVATRRGMRDRV